MNETHPETSRPEIQVTDQDLRRLRAVVEEYASGEWAERADELETELERAQVVPQRAVPPDVVTMRSRAVFENLRTGTKRELELVYPDEADRDAGKVSILAPAGLALLGLRVGDRIEWPMGGGRSATFRLLEVRYQPELAGELHL